MSAPDFFSVSRRFDLATVLVAMSGFALLFTGLRLLDFPPSVLGLFGALFTVVAIVQGAAARWHRPREASMLAGTLFWFVVSAAIFGAADRVDSCGACGALFSIIIVGPASGYLVGALVGGVFLISHYLRESGTLGRSRAEADAEPAESPWNAGP